MSIDVELREISFLSDDFEILQDVTITFPGGKSTVVIGPSGCGKSTLLKVAAGLHIPDKGKLLIGGKDFFKLSEIEVKKIRKQNGFVFQDSALWANRTMYQNLSIPLEFHFPTLSKKEIGLRVMRLLAKTGLDKQSHLRPEQLSSGEQKVVSFLRALVLKPALFFMDEPTLSMDEDKVVIIYDMIRELKDSGCTLIAVTHALSIETKTLV